MTDPLRRLQSGERLTSIPAAAWNAFVDAARFVRGLQVGDGLADTSLAVGPGQVLVLNNSGADRDQFDVLQLSEPVVTPAANAQEFARRIALTGTTPDADWTGSFVVLAEPIANGQIGRAWIDGACPARVNGGGGFADTKDGEAGYLQAGDVGSARILWSESGEAERMAYIRLNDPRSFVLVKTVAGPDDTPYPEEGENPTVYRCRMLTSPSFPKAAGAQVLSYTETDRFDHVLNLVGDHYVEEGSVLGALPLEGQLYTMDKLLQRQILVVGHSKGTTDKGVGSLSRLNPDTGAVLWTYDLGMDGSYPKIAYSVDLDSRGNVFVYWRRSADTAGASFMSTVNGTGQGVLKLSPGGNLLASFDLPASTIGAGGHGLEFASADIRVDPQDDDAIYVGCDTDADGKWLYRFDADLNVAWSIGVAETDPAEYGRCASVAIGNDGHVYAKVYSTWKITKAGAVVSEDVSALSDEGLIFDENNGRLCVAASEGFGGGIAVAGYNPFPTRTWSHARTDFPTPEALGAWTIGGGQKFVGSSGYADGVRNVYATSNVIRYSRAGGLGFGFASYLITDPDGAVVGSGAWGDPIAGGLIQGMARDRATGQVFVAGRSGSGTLKIAGQIDPPNNTTAWAAPVYSTPGGVEYGWAVAVRTVRG